MLAAEVVDGLDADGELLGGLSLEVRALAAAPALDEGRTVQHPDVELVVDNRDDEDVDGGLANHIA